MKKLPKYVARLKKVRDEFNQPIKRYRLYRVYPFCHIAVTQNYSTFSEFAGMTTRQEVARFVDIDDVIEYLNRWVGNYKLNDKKYITNRYTCSGSMRQGNTGQELFDLIFKIILFGVALFFLIPLLFYCL